MIDKNYLTTGEFAKLCNTTKHTLFHYYDIGLFLPEITDENGYRYYHVLQYDTFITIRQLSELGMKLSEIKNYFLNRSPQNMIKIYKHQEQLLNAKIKYLNALKSNIIEHRKNIENAFSCNQKYFLENLDKQYLISSEELNYIDDKLMTYEFGTLLKKSKNITVPLTFGMVHNISDIKKNSFAFRFYTRTDTYEDTIRVQGTYLCTYYYGKYENLFSQYNYFLNYAENHGGTLEEQLYIETGAGEWTAGSAADYIIKIFAKISL